jgi:hypothetical protein
MNQTVPPTNISSPICAAPLPPSVSRATTMPPHVVRTPVNTSSTDATICPLSVLDVRSIVWTCGAARGADGAATAGRTLGLIGCAHLGHALARVDTGSPQSGQFTSDMRSMVAVAAFAHNANPLARPHTARIFGIFPGQLQASPHTSTDASGNPVGCQICGSVCQASDGTTRASTSATERDWRTGSARK